MATKSQHSLTDVMERLDRIQEMIAVKTPVLGVREEVIPKSRTMHAYNLTVGTRFKRQRISGSYMAVYPRGMLLNSTLISDLINKRSYFAVDMSNGSLIVISGLELVEPLTS